MDLTSSNAFISDLIFHAVDQVRHERIEFAELIFSVCVFFPLRVSPAMLGGEARWLCMGAWWQMLVACI